MGISEFLGNLLGYLIFFGLVVGIPLFFISLIARDLVKKKEQRRQLVQSLVRPHDSVNDNLKDAEKLIWDLSDDLFPWIRTGAINNLVRNDSRGVKTIITALDLLPYYTDGAGYVVTQADFFTIREMLVKALAKIGRSSVENLNDALQHPNLNVRMAAISALGEINNPFVVELLVRCMASPNLEERMGAIEALGKLRATSVTEKIISSLQDSSPAVREMGIRALRQMNDVRALPALKDLARTDHTVIDERPITTIKDLAEAAILAIQKNNPDR